MKMKYENPKLKQSEIANQLGYSSSSLQRYRKYLNMLSSHRIQSNSIKKRTKKASNTNFNNDSHREPDVKRPQMTLKQHKQIQNQQEKQKCSKAGSMHENNETNDHY